MSGLADQVGAKLQQLVDCIQERMDFHAQAPLCFLGAIAGGPVAYDYIASGACMENGTDGQGWVRLVNTFPYTQFPIPAVNAQCGSFLAATVELGIIRTVFGVTEEDPIPGADAQLAMMLRQLQEQQVLYEAITCCYPGDIRIGTWQPIGPQGMAIGGAWMVTIDIDGD